MEEEKPKYNIIVASPPKGAWKEAFKISSIPVLLASLCCLSPILLLSVGLVGISAASELSDVLYGTYRWAFRAVGLVALIVVFIAYARRSGVCTLDDVKKRRNELLNKFILALSVGVIGYIVFLYVIVHYIGVFIGVWK